MDRFVAFPSIRKLSDALKDAKHMFGDNWPPELTFRGTVKLHGTHADLVWHGDDDDIVVQSRNRVLTVESDNHGCARFFDARKDRLRPLFERARTVLGGEGWPIVIAGEYCGEGVQSKVALCQLPRMFVVVAVKVGHTWHLAGSPGFADVCDEAHGIYNISRAPTFTLTVDPLEPAPALAQADEFTQSVEAECPFAKGMGIAGAGEGIVWACTQSNSSRLWFKTKGASHMTPVRPQGGTSNTGRAALDTLVCQLVTEQRLDQGVDFLREMGHPLEMRSVPQFVRWVTCDVLKEEHASVVDSGFKDGDVRKAVSRVAVTWFAQRAASSFSP